MWTSQVSSCCLVSDHKLKMGDCDEHKVTRDMIKKVVCISALFPFQSFLSIRFEKDVLIMWFLCGFRWNECHQPHNPSHTVNVCMIIDDHTYKPDANTWAAHVAGQQFAIVVVLLCNYGGPHVQKHIFIISDLLHDESILCIFSYMY